MVTNLEFSYPKIFKLSDFAATAPVVFRARFAVLSGITVRSHHFKQRRDARSGCAVEPA
jgi:hypothetical protein